MSMCFDFEELLLLLEYNTVELLSQYNFNGLSIAFTTPSLVTKFRSHIPWLEASYQDINYADIVEEAISVYLALLQDITPPVSMKT